VEDCFTKQSALKPRHTKLYWMGLSTGELGATWPNFTWIDRGNAIYKGDYQHWGVLVNATGQSAASLPRRCKACQVALGWRAGLQAHALRAPCLLPMPTAAAVACCTSR
jgi:hypothetical protein